MKEKMEDCFGGEEAINDSMKIEEKKKYKKDKEKCRASSANALVCRDCPCGQSTHSWSLLISLEPRGRNREREREGREEMERNVRCAHINLQRVAAAGCICLERRDKHSQRTRVGTKR